MAKYKIIPSSRTIVHSPISIGHKAEKGVEAIEFDLTAWVETYGSGTLTVIMWRWGDAIPYPIALEIDENNKATWTLSDIDTAKAGMAYAQLNYIVGETVVKKSDIYTFRVMDSLTGEGEPPEAYESWLGHLTHLAAEAMAEVLDIEGVVTDKTLTVDGGIADAKAAGDALALKADKSTTYTKTQVDQMIADIEAETDTTLSVSGKPADAAETGRQIGSLKADLGDKVDLPSNGYGTSGKVLRSTGTGTEWTTVGQPTDAQTAEAVTDWLNEHPEATTSVQDDSITESKLHLNSVTTPKIQDGAVTDNKTADEYKNLFYEEVTVSTGRMSNTDYYLVTVPKYDSDNVLIPLSLSYNANQNPLEQAWDRCTTVTINGYGMLNANGTYRNGIGICDGVITTNFSFENIANDCPLYLGVKADRTILEYKMNSAITPQEMLADGCVNVFNCYFKLVENGQVVAGLAEGELYIGDTLVTEETRNPLMLMGLKPDGTIMFMACDGRTAINDGLTYLEAGELLISQGCNTVYNLDGGGSACLVVRGSKLNRNIDSNGTVVRQIRYALNVIKPSANTPTKKVYKKIGEEKQKLIEQIVPYINYINGYSLAKIGKTITANTDLNTLLDEGKYQCANKSVANTLVNSPVNIGFSLYCLHQGGSTAITQLLISNPSGTGKQRVYYRCLNPSNNTVQYEWSQFSPDTINFDLTADSNISAGRKTCTLNGKTVCISITFTVGNEIASEGVLFTLPSTLKPTSYIEFIALKREDLTTKLLQIKPNGTICVGAYGSLTQGSYKANVTWNIA